MPRTILAGLLASVALLTIGFGLGRVGQVDAGKLASIQQERARDRARERAVDPPPPAVTATVLKPGGRMELAGDDADRELWRTANSEHMARTWAKKVRPGRYHAQSVQKLMFVLVATVEDAETGQLYALKVEVFPKPQAITLKMWPTSD